MTLLFDMFYTSVSVVRVLIVLLSVFLIRRYGNQVLHPPGIVHAIPVRVVIAPDFALGRFVLCRRFVTSHGRYDRVGLRP